MTLAETLKEQALAGARTVAANDALQSRRARALASLAQGAFPERRSERWKYTSLQPLAEGYLASLHPESVPGSPVPDFGGIRIEIRNGRLPEALPALPRGVTIEPLSRAGTEPQQPDEEVFSHYNAAALLEGVRLRVAAGTQVASAIHVVFIDTASGSPASVAVRLEADLGEGARLALVEHYHGQGPVLTSATTRLRLADASRLLHYRLQTEASESLHLGRVDMDIGRDCQVRSFQLMEGCRLRRNEIRARLLEPGADLSLAGIFVVRDDDHADNQVSVEHCAPHCRSQQIYKGIVGERGRGVFNGRIHIHRGARGTDAHLDNRNLLLSREAEIDTKPELEIYNDDVKCSHGTTVGQLDPGQLFYLQSRGISRELAGRMLGTGFVNELVRGLPDEAISAWASDWLGSAL